MNHSLIASVIFLTTALPAAAATTLFDYAYNIDGVVTAAPGVPSGVNDVGFDYTTGLGTIVLSFGTAGSHFAGLFVDHEIDEATNTFFNEFGQASGAPGAGWSWEIDEPGFVFGDIFQNFSGSDQGGSLLDNSSGVAPGQPDDVSMALGWQFVLAPGESAAVSFSVSAVAPGSGFYLQHTDPHSDASLYFSGRATISGPGTAVPDGLSTGMALCAVSLLGHFCRRWAVAKSAGAGKAEIS